MKRIILFVAGMVIFFASATAQIQSQKKVVTPVKTPVVTAEKKPVMVMSSQKVTLHKPLKITSHTDGQDAYGAIQILGTGEPGLEITVNLYAYAEVTPKNSRSLWETFKAITIPTSTYDAIHDAITKKVGPQVKEKYFNSYKVTVDKNGKWYIPVFLSTGSVDWTRSLYIPFAWVVSAFATNPNYREGNYTSIRLGCKIVG